MPELNVYRILFHWGNKTIHVVAYDYGEAIMAALMRLPKNTDFGFIHQHGLDIIRLEGEVVVPSCQQPCCANI